MVHRLQFTAPRRLATSCDNADEAGLVLRQVHHGPTRVYTSRRIAQGKTRREALRCLKRTGARQLYRLLERTAPTDP